MKQKQYLRVGQNAKNRLFGVAPAVRRGPSLKEDRKPLQMLVSQQTSFSHSRLAVIVFGLFTLAIGIILSSVPWVDFLIYKNLRLWNGTLSYYYWQKPVGVNRLTKVWVFNVTNPARFLNNGEKPKLQEVGPFVYRENMEKVNIKFNENGTVTFQHKKLLHFVPELSLDRNTPLVVPNIPLLTLTSKAAELSPLLRMPISMALKAFYKSKVFNQITADQLMFGFEEKLTRLANTFYPRGKRPPSKMGLLIGRNTSLLSDIQTIEGGALGNWKEFGLMTRLNGFDHLPYWHNDPCNSIRASEGSFFPPRDVTKEDVVNVWDKDLCRVWPLRYRGDSKKDGIKVGVYTTDDDLFTSGDSYKPNKCFCPGRQKCPPDGLQSIRPCQFDSPIFVSLPHYLGVKDEKILNEVEGLSPDPEKHTTVFKIQPKLGVPLEGRVRVQINLQVSHSSIGLVRKFPSITFPLCWVEEGVEELPGHLYRLIYLATTLCDWLVPLGTYSLIVTGSSILIFIFVKSYRHVVFNEKTIARGRATLRRGSSFLVNGQHRLLILRDSYTRLENQMSETSLDPDP